MFALCDANNFYCSVEQVFQPGLRAKPLIVLSNNDGCAIARSAEAKSLGVKMAQPLHEIHPMIRRQIVVRSANFALYGDMSARIVSILRDTGRKVEVYSIDESFIDLSGMRDREKFCLDLRDRIRRWTGIPNCIGIGPTKTLAKLANKVAKTGAGVVDVSEPKVRRDLLDHFPAGDIWGVGRKFAARLAEQGITTASELCAAPPDLILARFGVTLSRTQKELLGLPCMGLDEVEPDRQQIVVSRSFGARVEDHDAVAQAIATFAIRACEKLRSRGLATSAVWIFANTDHFHAELKQHHPSRSTALLAATSDSRVVLSTVTLLMRNFLREGYAYKRAGIALMDLARPEQLQADLFSPATIGNPALMSTLDTINRRFGRGAVGLGASGWKENPEWGMKQKNLSPNFTTRLSDIPLVQC